MMLAVVVMPAYTIRPWEVVVAKMMAMVVRGDGCCWMRMVDDDV